MSSKANLHRSFNLRLRASDHNLPSKADMAISKSTVQAPEGLSIEDSTQTILDLDIKPSDQPEKSRQIYTSRPSLPPITTVTDDSPNKEHYIITCAELSAHASLTDPLTIFFQIEKPDNDLTTNPPPTASALLPLLSAANIARLTDKVATGSILVESANFAATACWTPPTPTLTRTSPSELDAIARSGLPLFTSMLNQIESAKEKHLYPLSKPYWHMSLMARDPRREYVPGAVRAVFEPFLKAADDSNLPVWIEAGSPRARDVYAHFGFEAVEIMVVGEVNVWCMIRRCQA